jgi:hypothetical protein
VPRFGRDGCGEVMADLNSLPDLNLPIEAQVPLVDYGPPMIDVQTVTRFVDLIESGIVTFEMSDSELTALLADAGEQLDALFELHLASPSTNRFVVDHRAFALVQAARELVARSLPSAPPTQVMDDVPRAIGNLEVFMAEFASSHLEVDPALLALQQVEPFVVSALIGASEGQLATWRSNNVGPRFVKLAAHKRSIRYPAAALLEWLESI